MNDVVTMPAGIDVDAIMAAIRNTIEEKKRGGILRQSDVDDIAQMELIPLPDFLEIPNVYEPHLYPGFDPQQFRLSQLRPLAALLGENPPPITPYKRPPQEIEEGGNGLRGLIKRVLRKTRSLLFPLIRFMTRPLYLELQNGILDSQESIHHLGQELPRIHSRIDTHRNNMTLFRHDLIDYLTHIQHLSLQSREYIKLLHNTANNVIVEATKAKVEQELLKTKIKVLEDRLDFLENRQRSLERKALP
jgi:hypothetical protein